MKMIREETVKIPVQPTQNFLAVSEEYIGSCYITQVQQNNIQLLVGVTTCSYSLL